MTHLRSAALSDIGHVRRENEDRYLNTPEAGLFGVSDGVGGLPGGGEAAQCTVEEITRALAAVPPDTAPDLVPITQAANERVHRLGATLSPSFGIGATLTYGVVRQDLLLIAHVGDSRCYGWREGELLQLTDDHSVENEARLRRAKGEVVYFNETNRNALTRCIGQPTPPAVDVIRRPLRAGDRYLFCTDGVFRVVRDREIAEFLGLPESPERMASELVALALKRGGPDNVTVVVVVVDTVATR